MTLIGASVAIAWRLIAGCGVLPDVVITEVESGDGSLEPTLRYAYFREDPSNQRIHVRFADYWNPCVADAQLQNQVLRNPAPADQAEAYRRTMPRRTWSADLYLNVARWPDEPQRDLSFDVVPQQANGTPNYSLVCLLRQCPYETPCDRCLPAGDGAVLGLSRTTRYLDAEYFENNFSDARVQQYASSGTVDISEWRPAAPTSLLEDTGGGTVDPSAFIRGTARLAMREVGQERDASTLSLEFTAPLCEPMQGTFTDDLAGFEQGDLDAYGPPATSCHSAGGASGLAAWLALLALLRRTRARRGNHVATASEAGALEQP